MTRELWLSRLIWRVPDLLCTRNPLSFKPSSSNELFKVPACSSDAKAAGRVTEGEPQGHRALWGCCWPMVQGPSRLAMLGMMAAARSPGTVLASPSHRRVAQGQGQTKCFFCLSQAAEIFFPSLLTGFHLHFTCIAMQMQFCLHYAGML